MRAWFGARDDRSRPGGKNDRDLGRYQISSCYRYEFRPTTEGGRVRSRALLLAAAFFAVASVPAAAQQQQATGALMVNVKNKTSGEPLSGAQVSLQGTRIGGITNEQGRYLLPAAPVGNYTVTVTFLGFSEIRQNDVAITAGQTTTLEVGMEQAVLSLEQIVATGVTDPTAG